MRVTMSCEQQVSDAARKLWEFEKVLFCCSKMFLDVLSQSQRPEKARARKKS
jgi:hypothetical protein